MNKILGSIAARMARAKSIDYCRAYLTLHPDATREDLYPCEYGHEHCAQFKNGACSTELAGLLKGAA